MKKKGGLVWEKLNKWIIGLIVFALLLLAYSIIKGDMQNIIQYLKNNLGGGF